MIKNQRKTCFLFPGQGSQQVGMAKGLYGQWDWFRHEMATLFSLCPYEDMAPLNDVMLGLNGRGDLLMETQYTQPILYALEIVLARMWARWGIKPDMVIGHSLGELAAAAVAGVFSEEDGMRIAFIRGRLMQNLNLRGKYAAVLGESLEVIEIVAPYHPDVVIAGSNAPEITVVSGQEGPVMAVLEACKERGMKYRLMNVSLPFHSPWMQPMIGDFERALEAFSFNTPKISWLSTMSGLCLRETDNAGIDYWKAQITEPVRFWAAMYAAGRDGKNLFLEVGSGRALVNMAQQAIGESDHIWLTTLNPKEDDFDAVKHTANALFTEEFDIDLTAVEHDLGPMMAPC